MNCELRVFIGSLALCSFLVGQPALGAGISGEESNALALSFPLTALEPRISGKERAENGTIIFSQPLRPDGAIRLKDGFDILVKGDKSPPVAFPAGAIFVKAISSGEEFYCASKSLKPSGFMRWPMELGVCLRDYADDGVFDEFDVTTQKGWRIRSPYELLYRGTAKQDAQIAYEKLPTEEIPVLDLRGVFYNDGNLLQLGVGTVSLGICWPPELTLQPVTFNGISSAFCALPDWKSNKLARQEQDVQMGRHSISLRQGTNDKITWGPVSINYVALDNDLISAQIEAAMPLGPVVAQAKSAIVIGMNIKDEIYVLDVKSNSGEILP
jgi:hypothetical protein